MFAESLTICILRNFLTLCFDCMQISNQSDCVGCGGTQIGCSQGSNSWCFISGTVRLTNCALKAAKNQALVKHFGHLKCNPEPGSVPHILYIHRPTEGVGERAGGESRDTNAHCSRRNVFKWMSANHLSDQPWRSRNSVIVAGMRFKRGEKGWGLYPVTIHLSLLPFPPSLLSFLSFKNRSLSSLTLVSRPLLAFLPPSPRYFLHAPHELGGAGWLGTT